VKTCKYLGILIAILIAALALFLVQRAWADVAPDPHAAASDIAPGQGTQVQMISETVVLDVQAETLTSGGDDVGYNAFTRTVALVTADFLMRNLGSATETMNVRFPMSWPTSRGEAIGAPLIIQNVNVWVDSKQVVTHQTTFDGQPWMVWPTTFLPGQDVRMTVKYRTTAVQEWGNSLLDSFSSLKLMGNDSLADFYYILETGAGWRGPIGQGDIIFRFPYPASPEMIEQQGMGAVYTSTTPAFVAQGNELRWHFQNLEPTSQDNVRLSVVTPPVWQAILDARRQAQSQPNDAQAQLRLGEAYWAAVPVKNTWPEELSLADHFGPLAEAAFKRAVELAPDSIPAQVAYARFLTYRAWSQTPEPYYSRASQQVKRVFALDPGDKDAQELSNFLSQTVSLNLPTPAPTSTVQPDGSVTVAPSHSSTPAIKPTPVPTVTSPPNTATPSVAQPGMCGSGAAVLLVARLAVALGWRFARR